METNPENLRVEYEHAQLAIRALDRQILELQSERWAWVGKCQLLIQKSVEQGEPL